MAKQKEGDLLRNYFKGRGELITDIAVTLGMTRSNLNYHLAKEELERNFVHLVEKTFKIDLKPIIQPTKEIIPVGRHANTRLKKDEYTESYTNWKGVPMYNVPVTAGFISSYRDEKSYTPQYYLHDPRFRDCEFGAIITGDSMHSEIRHGDFIACKEVTDMRFIVYGEIYYVIATNGLETCKYINADPNDDDNYLLVPRNERISPSPIPKDMILKIYKVRGIIRGY